MKSKIDKYPRYKVIDSFSGRTLLKADNLASVQMNLEKNSSKRITVYDAVEKQFFSASSLFNEEYASFRKEFQLSLEM